MTSSENPHQTGLPTRPQGEGPASQTWVLLRGLTREATHWGSFPAALQRALPKARILTTDLPGNGQWHKQVSPATVQGMVAACRAECVRQGIHSPVHLLAMSLGAMVAAEWAQVAPDEVAACVLINTSLKPFSPMWHRLLPRNYRALWRLALGRLPPEAAEREVFRMTCNHPDRQVETVRGWVRARTERPVSAGNALRQLLAAARYRAPLQSPPVPILILSSTQDHLVSHRCSQAIAQAWSCPLRAHSSAGHDLPHDDPDWVVRQVRDWLNSLPP